jgi:hypothetical protein
VWGDIFSGRLREKMIPQQFPLASEGGRLESEIAVIAPSLNEDIAEV